MVPRRAGACLRASARPNRTVAWPRKRSSAGPPAECRNHEKQDRPTVGAPSCDSPVARPAAASVVGRPRPIGSEPWFPAEGGADVCWTRANADRDEVGQCDLADRRPRSANREAEAVMGLQSPATTPSRSTFVTRFLAGLDEPRPRPHRRSSCRVCGRSSGPRRTAAGVAQRLPRSRRPPCRCCSDHAGEAPARTGFFSGLSRRPARPIAFAVVATMRTGFEVGPRVGRQERMYRRRRRWAEASRRSSPPLSLCYRCS